MTSFVAAAVVALLVVPVAAFGADGGLLAAAERAPATVVGRPAEPERLDRHGWSAELSVEQSLRGPDAESAVLRVAWEELASEAAPRLREGQLVLLVLEPLPDWSLWRERLPEGGALAIAARGTALLRDPDAATIETLRAHLAGTRPRIATLAALVRSSQPPLASEAVGALGRSADLADLADLAQAAGETARSDLDAALRDEARPETVRRALLELAGSSGLDFLRSAVAELAVPAAPLEAPALDALARLDGALAPDRTRALLGRGEGAVRAVAVRHGAGTLDVAALAALVRTDPSPEVRVEAVSALVERSGSAALEAASAALFDGEPRVVAAAAARIGRQGARALPLLRRLALENGSPEANGPLAALSHAGQPGRAALQEIVATHEDPRVRKLARLALGIPEGRH